VQTLASTAICGIVQSFIGGQPLLIVGVSEPTSLVYTYMFNFVKNRSQLGPQLFLAWAAWYVICSHGSLDSLPSFKMLEVHGTCSPLGQHLCH
jgi:hypothetical protein